MPKILHLAKYYYPERGGIETVVKNLAEYSASHGYSVTVLCFSHKNQFEQISKLRIIRTRQQIKFKSQPLSLIYFVQGIILSWKADIIHLHAPNFLSYFILLFVKNKNNIIIHWHSDVLTQKVNLLLKYIETIALNRSTSVICTSQEYSKTSKTLSPFVKKITIIPIGIEVQTITYSKTNKTEELDQLIAGRTIILSVGRLVPYKGFKYLIEASNNFDNDVVTLIVGNGPEFRNLQSQIFAANLSDKVILLGSVSDEELQYLYKRAHVFCLPSINRAEAFGVVLIEAMSHKLPLVSFNIPGSGVTSLNKDFYNGRIAELYNSTSLYSCLQYLVSNVEQRTQFGNNSYFDFSSFYTNNVSCEKTTQLYMSLLTS